MTAVPECQGNAISLQADEVEVGHMKHDNY